MTGTPSAALWDPHRPFTWRDGERTIHFGRGAAADAGDLIDTDFALLATRRGLGEAHGLARMADQTHVVGAGRVEELARALRPRVRGGTLLAVGGGTVIDVAKALAAADPPRRVVAIPTTLSGAEMTAAHRMIPGLPPGRRRVRPVLVVADPLLMASQAPAERAASAMNALAHAAEAPLTRRASPLATLASVQAATWLMAGLESGDADTLALGAVLAGYAVGTAGFGIHHVMAQTLVREAGVGHGAAHAVLLPHTLDLLAGRGGNAVWPEGMPDVVRRGAAERGAARLRDLGVARPALRALADAAAHRAELDDMPPRPAVDDLLSVYEAAW